MEGCTPLSWSQTLAEDVIKGTGQNNSNRTHLWDRRGGSQRHHLSSNITNNILLAFKFELTQKYSASKSRHHKTNKKGRFESHCNFLLLDRGVAMQ